MLRLTLTTTTALAAAAALAAPAAALAAGQDSTTLLDRPPGAEALPLDGIGYSHTPPGSGVSADGRYVAFTSTSDDLSDQDDDAITNVYRRDRQTGVTTLISVGVHTTAYAPAISGDGQVVAFVTEQRLSPADTNSATDVYVRDVAAGTTELASRRDGAAGTAGLLGSWDPALDADGSTVAFTTSNQLEQATDTNSRNDVYRRDRATAQTDHVSRAPGANGTNGATDTAHGPALSANGAIVAFTTSGAYDVADDTNGVEDVYVRSGTATELVSRVGDLSSDAYAAGARAASISADGTRVAFESTAAYVAGDVNDVHDVYVRDRSAQTLVLASRKHGLAGQSGTQAARDAALSPDGGYVAFGTAGGDLGPADADGEADVYLRALAAGTTTLISRGPGPDGGAGPGEAGGASVATGGGTVVFDGVARGLSDLVDGDVSAVFARTGGTNELVSRPSGPAGAPFRGGVGDADLGRLSVSADGRFAVFASDADNLSDEDADQFWNVYVHDLLTGTVRLVSRPAGGGLADGDSGQAVISADGTHVAFLTRAANIGGPIDDKGAHLVVVALATGAVQVADVSTGGVPSANGAELPALDADGSRVAFASADKLHPDDPSTDPSVYVRDLAAGTTELASRAVDGSGAGPGESTYPSLSADGTRVAFQSTAQLHPGTAADARYDVYVRDLAAGTTLLASAADGSAESPTGDHVDPAISADGRRVAFDSPSPALAPGDSGAKSDVFVRDLDAGRTYPASVDDAGVKGDGASIVPALSADGMRVAFLASGTVLAEGSDQEQVVVRDLAAGTTRIVSRAHGAGGALANDGADAPAISADAGCVAFGSRATNLIAGGYDSAEHEHAYLRAASGTCPAAGAAPAGGGTGGGATGGSPSASAPKPAAPARDRVAPKVSGVQVVRGRGKRRTTTSLRFTVSEAARVTVTLSRKVAGRRRGKACVRPAQATKRAKRCTRLVVAKTLTVQAKAGTNAVTLPRGLARGAYAVGVAARDGAGNGSNPRTVALRVGS